MNNFSLGQQVLDIRNGEYHIITDYEYVDNQVLYYTNKKTCILNEFIVDTNSCLLFHLIERIKNNRVITEWLRKNGEIKSIKLKDGIDIESVIKNAREKCRKK